MLSRAPSLALLRSLQTSSICFRCARRLANSGQAATRPLTRNAQRYQGTIARDDSANKTFFWANAFRDGSKRNASGSEESQETALRSEGAKVEAQTVPLSAVADQQATASTEPPHRRRKRLKAASNALATGDTPLPPDASSILSRDAAAAPARSFRRALSVYLSLSKPRLAFLIVLTTTASYSIYPVPALLSTTATAAPSLSTLTLLYLTSGTFLTIASANTLNMLFEPQHDAKMSRTRNRPLVRGLVSKRAALLFALATGLVGTGMLWYGVNPTTAMLGAGNLALYAFAYTPLKRIHPVNTWVGAVVGAVPPLMGWCAAASQYSLTNASNATWSSIFSESKELLFTEQAIGGWLIAALLFAWQFPHFFALSHGVRNEYAGAGYKMLSSSNTAMATRVSLRYSLAMFPICAGLSYYQVTDPAFVATSGVVNAWMLREAVRFWRHQGERGSARALFWASVWQLPIVLVLAMVQKKGLWNRLIGGADAEPEDDELWDEDEEE
ncbi:UbiA prenyltransferase family-domain-containing protein [Neohortaea acidophila]|uniref:Protoheme IX farnesyltransferase, mitochondrial n=1 Tax=Neohortaea acidophila TaxID=245834 RepID=A0A6A6PWD8_9PEZI|nr:UbiA prenyltransferase family-domain-containing protein [Neohortaea acidophila]KAF2484044.1 UbiA prenyltransferase family-domain-containing protein [Neohortaea acidophila]